MMNTPKLKAPEYKIISSLASINSEDSLTIIDLGTITTKKAIEKNGIIATGTINPINIKCKSLQDYESNVSEIYVIIPRKNHKGIISLTVNSDLVSSIISISEDDCYNIYSLYYGQNFEALSLVSDFCKTENITATIGNNELYGNYIQANSDSFKQGKFYSIVDLNIPENESYILEFDASIANTNTNNSSIFYIFTDQSNKNSYILKMSSPTYNNGRNNMK